MHYHWDPLKDASNLRKHGISFADAVAVFDGHTLEWPDERFDYAERRWIAIGIAGGQEIVVVYVEEGEDARRILSARPATKGERAFYWATVGRQD